MTHRERNDEVRERLLDEAEKLFAVKGYSTVTVREITSAANCNLAAVNYYFTSKRSLYMEVFRSRWMPRSKRIREFFNNLVKKQQAPSAVDVMQALAQSFLAGPLSDEERERHHQLISRELTQPSEALEMVTEQVMRPFFRDLAERLGPLLPEKKEPIHLMLDILCFFSMVLYFNFARGAVTRITGRNYDPDFKEQLIAQITRFSSEGLCRGLEEKVP